MHCRMFCSYLTSFLGVLVVENGFVLRLAELLPQYGYRASFLTFSATQKAKLLVATLAPSICFP